MTLEINSHALDVSSVTIIAVRNRTAAVNARLIC